MRPVKDVFGNIINPDSMPIPMANAAPAETLEPSPIPEIEPADLRSVTVVVTVYNQPRVVRPCLRALDERTPKDVALIVVDDGSAAYTKQLLVEEAWRMAGASCTAKNIGKPIDDDGNPAEYSVAFEPADPKGRRVTIVGHPNQRYTKSINRGMGAAFEDTSCSWAVALNSDVLVAPGWLERMLRAASQNQRIGIVCPYISTVGDGHDENPLQVHMPPGATYVEAAARLAALPLPGHDVAAVTPIGACMAVRRDLWQVIGPFDEEIGKLAGGYGEECDLWARATQRGWKAVIAVDAYVYHESHATYGALSAKGEKDGYEGFIARHRDWFNARKDEARAGDPRDKIAKRIPRLRVKTDRPRVAFYHEGINLCGGVLAPVGICNGLVERGIDATIAYTHDLDREWRLMRAKHSPIACRAPSEWIEAGGFDEGILIATDWRTGRFVSEVCNRWRGIMPAAFVQDREDWFLTSRGLPAFDSPMGYAAYLAVAKQRAVVNSGWVLESLVRDHQFDRSRMQHIGIGVDGDLFHDRGLRDKSEKVRILAMSRPSTPRRGNALLTVLYTQLHAKYGDSIELYTYGDWPDQHLPARHLGKLQQPKLAEEMARMHILVEPSTRQAWGMAAHEMMATGGVVVSHENGGIDNYGTHDADCLIAGAGPRGEQDAARMLDLLGSAIEDAVLRGRIGTAARKAALAWAWDRVCDSWAAQIRAWWDTLRAHGRAA